MRQQVALGQFAMAGTRPQWHAARDLAAEMMARFDLIPVDAPAERISKTDLAASACATTRASHRPVGETEGMEPQMNADERG